MPEQPPTDKWKLLRKRCVGLYASGPVAGPGWGNDGYYCAVWEMVEFCERTRTYRTRVENGPACREMGEGYTAFCSLYHTYLERAMRSGTNGRQRKHAAAG